MKITPALPYDRWLEDSMRSVIRQALMYAASDGLPGNHHFYISFLTHAEGVSLSPELKVQYPEEMTIVLQHQFWDLIVDEQMFAVTVKFHGRSSRLVIPFAVITGFVDPSVNFALQFRASEQAARMADADDGPAPKTEAPEAGAPPAGQVITLDSFRKK